MKKKIKCTNPVIPYFISLVILVIGCCVFVKTQDIVVRNAFMGAAYAMWGVTGYLILKETICGT